MDADREEKITRQHCLLAHHQLPGAELLAGYAKQLKYRDETNREGHAAKVYFNALFGMDFTRSKECALNAALNYGYSILLSLMNREISANGFLTQLEFTTTICLIPSILPAISWSRFGLWWTPWYMICVLRNLAKKKR